MNEQLEATVSQVLGTSALTMTPLAGDASTRRYFRLNLAQNGPYPTAILMWLPEPGIVGEELPFLNVHRELSKMNVSVPKIYHDGSKEQFLILEDLGDLLLQEAIREKKEGEIQSLYELALEEIFKMQFWLNLSQDCVASQLAFDEEKLIWELNFFLKHTLKGYLKFSFNEDEDKFLNLFFKNLSSFFSSPATLFYASRFSLSQPPSSRK